jgi:hypothetical protein
MKVRRIFKIVVVFPLVALMAFSSLLLIPSVPVVKADALSDVVNTIYSYEQSGGQYSFGPEIGSAITAGCLLAVTAGAAFESKGQIETFYTGFCNWTTAHGYNDQQWLAAAQTIGNQIAYTFSPTAVNLMHDYVTSIKVDPAMVSYVGSVGAWVAGVDVGGVVQQVNVSNINSLGLGSSALYYLSWGAMDAAVGAQIRFTFDSTDGKGFDANIGCSGAGPTAIPAGHAVIAVSVSATGVINSSEQAGNTLAINNFQMSPHTGLVSAAYPLIVNLFAATYSQTVPITMTLDRDLISNDYGNLTGIDEGVKSQSPSAVLDGERPVAVTVPLNPTYDDVIGKTATDTATGTVDTVISNTDVVPPGTIPIVPDWTQQGTNSIDWGPLTDLQLFDKFPFSLPWDFNRLVTGLIATPVAPVFSFDIPMSALHMPNFSFSVDFATYESAVVVFRWGFLLVVTCGLIFGAYKIIKH